MASTASVACPSFRFPLGRVRHLKAHVEVRDNAANTSNMNYEILIPYHPRI